MRRDYLIAILLAVAAFPAGASLMVAPVYLHLIGWQIPATFWGGIGLASLLIIAAIIVALRGEKQAPPVGHKRRLGIIIAVATIVMAAGTVGAVWLSMSPALQPLPAVPQQSRLDRFIFACDVPEPQTPEDAKRQKEAVQSHVQAWADTIGVSVSFSDIPNGMRVMVEAKTKEAKARFASMGLFDRITKVFLEARWIDHRQIIVAYAEVPKDVMTLSAFLPDPSAPQIIEGQNLIARFLGAPEGVCHLI
jgi:hypothetical protein